MTRLGGVPGGSIVVVTDSTAGLPAEVAREHAITVVPLQVVIGSETFDEGSPEATADAVAEALRAYRPVSTSRPPPAMFADLYDRLAVRAHTRSSRCTCRAR